MKQSVPEAKASLTLSSPIVLDAKIWEYVEPIFEALREAQHQSGRFRFYGYLAAVYRTYKDWKDLGIAKGMARRLAKQLPSPRRKNTSPVRTLIDATFPALDPKQKADGQRLWNSRRWQR